MKDIYGFLTFKKVEIIEKTDVHAHTTQFQRTIQFERPF